MNVALLDPFEINIPSEITHTLKDPQSYGTTCISFNRRGTLLAAGTREGFIHVWDLNTMGIISTLQGHVYPVSMLSWSRCGRYLMSSSLDWNCIIWDLKTQTRRDTLRFTSPVLMGLMHPRFDNVVVIVNQQNTPTLLVKQGKDWSRSSLIQPENKAHLLASSIAFSPDGVYILVGTTKGIILAYNTASAEFEFEYKVGTTLIKQIYFTRSGRVMIVNSNDRIIRTFSVDWTKNSPSITLELKFLDSVDRTQWLECRISADGEYVVGACGSANKHKIYIWDKTTGVLAKMLSGPMEGMMDMTWHPTRPIIATISSYSGAIFLWQHLPTQKYSAYDPTFVDIEDNTEYIEREDEFDEDFKIETKIVEPNDYSENVDVFSRDNMFVLSDTDDEGTESFHLVP